MKNIFFSCLLFFSILGINGQTNKVVKTDKGKLMLLGKVDRKGFNDAEFKWFDEKYDSYLTNDKIIKKLKKELKNYTIKAFFGSWCGDSKRNLPIFYKVLDEAGFPKENLEVIAVDRKKEAYKQAPNREEKGLNIHRVPTFVIYKKGKEVNRIVEYPKETFERDLLAIVKGEKYRSKYRAARLMNSLLKKSKDSLLLLRKELISFLPEIAEGVKELNTYGFVKLRANEYKNAEFVFQLNTRMYPNHYVPYSSLGIFYYEQKQFKKALNNFYKSLSLQPNNKEIKEMIEKINKNPKT